MATEIPQLPHLQMVGRGISQDYKSRSGFGKKLTPPRDRATHGSVLRDQLQSFVPVEQQRQQARAAANLQEFAPPGITIEFQSSAGFDLVFESLDLPSAGIELLNVRVVGTVTYATCYVPEGRLTVLIKKVREYLEKDTKFHKPKNRRLIESIDSIGLATIDALWTDEVSPPADDAGRWWEIWLRRDGLEPAACWQRFNHAAQLLGIRIAQRWLDFPERLVTNVEATRTQLARAVDLLNLIAEIRRADLPPALPPEPTLSQQDAFVDDMVSRLVPPTAAAVAVTLLDTGVNRGHPMLAPALDPRDLHTINAAWGTYDHHGHGTQMAGVALYGNMALRWGGTTGPVPLHRLESVKLLPPDGVPPSRETFGAVAQAAVAYCEIEAPERTRVFCKTVSSPMHQDGVPSSYSAAIDKLAYGDESGTRMIVLAAGNVPDSLWTGWPASNLTYGVEQPGQAWNALTVGAVTTLTALPGSADYAGWNAIAPSNELSPFSATSSPWAFNKWPIKPEVLFEGGNAAVDAAGQDVSIPATMQLLTTHANATTRPLTYTCMTSPAAAQGARLAALIHAEYPDYWPETVRGLIVHSARWTSQQRARFVTADTQDARRQLLCACGWGVAREQATLSSVRNRVTIVTQETVQPYKLESGKGAMNQMKVFALPWPQEQLIALAETPVRLRVTLSYFIDPSPSHRSWTNRYRYASHSLRFDLRRNNESEAQFNKRVNAAMLEKDEQVDTVGDEGWFLGKNLQSLGSIHSDAWTGMAIKLASRNLIAVSPVVGWWRECVERGFCESEVRFALLLTLEIPDQSIDLYSKIKAELEIPISAGLNSTLDAS